MRIVIYEAKESMNLIPPHYVYVKISKEAENDYFEVGKDEDAICDRKFHKEDFEHYDYYRAVWTNGGLIYVSKLTDKGWCDYDIFSKREHMIISADDEKQYRMDYLGCGVGDAKQRKEKYIGDQFKIVDDEDDEFEKYIAESIENDICNDPEFEEAASKIFGKGPNPSMNIKE